MRILDKAVKVFGLTDDPYEAGFILPDGSFLDFSGKRDGGPGHDRAMDHRQVEILFPHTTDERWPYLYRFMRLGAIRIGFTTGRGLTAFWAMFAIKPTFEQRQAIARLVRHSDTTTLDLVNRHAESLKYTNQDQLTVEEALDFMGAASNGW